MTIYRQFRVTYRKRLLVYSLLCVALATGNALFWLHKWHEQGVELCFADTMMTGVQPSFLLMLLIPPTLGLVHQLKFILEQPFVICALDNRARLARNLLAALLFIAFRAVMAVSIPSIALGALLFRGGKPCTWESGASYYDGPNVNNPCQNRLLDCLAGYDDLAHSLAGIDSFPVNQSFLRIAPTRKHTLMGRLPFGFVDVFVSCYTETI